MKHLVPAASLTALDPPRYDAAEAVNSKNDGT